MQETYSTRFQSFQRAAHYDLLHRVRPEKRWRTTREKHILASMLKLAPEAECILDLPCGGGRVTEVIAGHADVVLGMDIARAQVVRARDAFHSMENLKWAVANSGHIPLPDDSVDGVVCVRLLHHLETDQQRSELLGELFRVARQFVMISFTDRNSFRGRWRRFRRPDYPDNSVTIDWLAEQGRSFGMTLRHIRRIYPTSRHRYALFGV